MDVIHLNQKQLAVRWQVAEANLERWRSDRVGSDYLKIYGRVMYRLVDIESLDKSSMMQKSAVTFELL